MPEHDNQQEFLFADGDSPRIGIPDSQDPLVQDIARTWDLPLGKRVQVQLKPGESIAFLEGRLEIVAAPDLPFDRRLPLRLRIRGYEFSSQVLSSWLALDGS